MRCRREDKKGCSYAHPSERHIREQSPDVVLRRPRMDHRGHEIRRKGVQDVIHARDPQNEPACRPSTWASRPKENRASR
jgi:hypothetical protein